MLFDVFEILVGDFSDVVAADHHRKILSHSWNDFVHLGLVLDYWLLDA